MDSHILWVANTVFLTQIKENFIEAPREKFPFLPFKYANGTIGWLLMDFDHVDSYDWNTRRFLIMACYLKETRWLWYVL